MCLPSRPPREQCRGEGNRTDRQHTRADRGVDGDHVRADAGPFADRRAAVQHRERADHGVGLDLDRRLDPRRRRVDDRDPREHVCFVDPVAECSGGRGELDARVHPFRLGRIVGFECEDALAVVDEVPHGVGEVELALRVGRIEPVERRPERLSTEDVDRRVDFVEGELLRCRVRRLDDGPDAAVVTANDPSVAARIVPAEGEHRGGRVAAAVGLEERRESLRPKERRIAREDEHLSGLCGECVLRGRECVAGAPGRSWTATSTPSNSPAKSGELTTTSCAGSSARPASITQSTSRRPSSAWRCFGVAERIRVPSPPARTTAASLDAFTCSRAMAGAPGFEPGIAGPKPAALPLGYAPPVQVCLAAPHRSSLPAPSGD